MSTLTPREPAPPARMHNALSSGATMLGIVAIMWILEGIDVVLGNSLDNLGIHAHTSAGLWQIFLAPWLHYGWAHLTSNSVPLFVLGWLVLVRSRRDWAISAVVIVICSGLAAWAFSPPGSITLGASGVVFGWLAFLLVKGLFTHKLSDIVIAVMVFLVYGSVLWGVLPGTSGVSWQGHMGGAIGGVASASLLHRHREPPAVTSSYPNPYR